MSCKYCEFGLDHCVKPRDIATYDPLERDDDASFVEKVLTEEGREIEATVMSVDDVGILDVMISELEDDSGYDPPTGDTFITFDINFCPWCGDDLRNRMEG